MDALIRPRLALFYFALTCAIGPGVVSALPGITSAKQNGALALSSDPDKAMLMRREDHAAVDGPAESEGHDAVYSVDGPDSVKIMTPVTDEDQEAPCDPNAPLSMESLTEDMAGRPTKAGATTTPDPAHMAPKLDPNKPAKLGPCAVLSKLLTPALAHGHIVVKAPDGNSSQVPEEAEEKPLCIGKLCTHMSFGDWAIYYITKSCMLAVVGGFFLIIVSRAGQDAKVKKMMADKALAKAHSSVEGHEARIAEMVAAGAAAGAIEAEIKGFEKAQAEKAAAALAPGSGAAPSAGAAATSSAGAGALSS